MKFCICQHKMMALSRNSSVFKSAWAGTYKVYFINLLSRILPPICTKYTRYHVMYSWTLWGRMSLLCNDFVVISGDCETLAASFAAGPVWHRQSAQRYPLYRSARGRGPWGMHTIITHIIYIVWGDYGGFVKLKVIIICRLVFHA